MYMQQNAGSKSEHQAEEAKFSDKKVPVPRLFLQNHPTFRLVRSKHTYMYM